jgi:hypothetical protein
LSAGAPASSSCSDDFLSQHLQHALILAECADDSLDRAGRELDESRRHVDAVGERALRLAKYIHNLNLVLIWKIRSANRGEVCKRLHRVLRVGCGV